MKTLPWSDPSLAEALLRQGQDEEVVVMREGHPVALVVPLDDEDLAWYLREREPAFIESIAAARADIAGGLAVTHDELKRELGI